MKNNSAVKEQEAASAMVTAELSKKEIAALERDWQKRLAQMESEWRQKLGDAAKKLEDATAASSQELIAGREAAEKAAQELRQRVSDTEREWEKRLQDGMRECERKFAAERKDSDKKFAEMEKQWLARVQENEQLWSTFPSGCGCHCMTFLLVCSVQLALQCGFHGALDGAHTLRCGGAVARASGALLKLTSRRHPDRCIIMQLWTTPLACDCCADLYQQR
jgi:hypothetical protein